MWRKIRSNYVLKEIKEISNDMVNSYLKKYEKMNENV